MFDKINDWYQTNYNEITWFLIGFLVCSSIDSFGRGDLFSASLDLFIAVINYALYCRR